MRGAQQRGGKKPFPLACSPLQFPAAPCGYNRILKERLRLREMGFPCGREGKVNLRIALKQSFFHMINLRGIEGFARCAIME